MDRVSLKNAAKAQIKGNIGVLFVCYLIIAVISAVCSGVTMGIAAIVVVPPLSLGLIMIYLGMYNGSEARIETLFKGFKINFVKSILVEILVFVFTFLWSLLFVIPGIIKAFSYSMSMYILAENPQMTSLEAINESKRIMHGHKMDLFVLYLSFIPWYLLVMITFGIAGIYVAPYMYMTITNFYKSISGSAQYQGEAAETDDSSNGGAFYAE